MASSRSIPPVCAGCGSADLMLTDAVGADGARHGLCRVCNRLQEVETRAEPCAQLCDNCAYRPGSPERRDPMGWAQHRDRHVEDGHPFYCHKGLALDFDPHGATHVIVDEASTEEALKKPCAGWIAARLAHLHKRKVA